MRITKGTVFTLAMFVLAAIYIALISQSVLAAQDKKKLVPAEFDIISPSTNRN